MLSCQVPFTSLGTNLKSSHRLLCGFTAAMLNLDMTLAGSTCLPRMPRETLSDAAAMDTSDALSPIEAAAVARHCRAAGVEDLLLWLSGYEVGAPTPL